MEYGFSLGSNLGDRLANLQLAKTKMLELPDVTWCAQSKVYETEPVGVKPEHQHLNFLNTVLVVASERIPEDWLDALHRIENELGRKRGIDRFAPRILDIDMLFAGDTCIDTGTLQVPHPRWSERRFVLAPLADARPDLVLPGAGKTVREMLAALPAGEPVELWREDW